MVALALPWISLICSLEEVEECKERGEVMYRVEFLFECEHGYWFSKVAVASTC